MLVTFLGWFPSLQSPCALFPSVTGSLGGAGIPLCGFLGPCLSSLCSQDEYRRVGPVSLLCDEPALQRILRGLPGFGCVEAAMDGSREEGPGPGKMT